MIHFHTFLLDAGSSCWVTNIMFIVVVHCHFFVFSNLDYVQHKLKQVQVNSTCFKCWTSQMYINISSCPECHTGLGVDLLSCDLLREGAPIEPVPPVTHWKPDAVVREDAYTLPLERVEAWFSIFAYPCLGIFLPMCLCSPVKCLFGFTAAKK